MRWNNGTNPPYPTGDCRLDPKDPGTDHGSDACYKGTSACFIFELGPGSGGPLRFGPIGGVTGGTDYILAHPLIWPVWGFRHGFGIDGVLETDLSFGLDGPPGGNGICGAGAGTYAGVPAPPGQPVPPPICGNPGMGTWGETQLEVWRQV